MVINEVMLDVFLQVKSQCEENAERIKEIQALNKVAEQRIAELESQIVELKKQVDKEKKM